jgi:hypothetical protein
LGLQQFVGYSAQRFLTGEAIEFRRSLVPIGNAVAGVTNDDCIIAQVQQASLLRECSLCLPAFSNIAGYV